MLLRKVADDSTAVKAATRLTSPRLCWRFLSLKYYKSVQDYLSIGKLFSIWIVGSFKVAYYRFSETQ